MSQVEHIAINADDVEAACAFYEAACGWKFEAWGPSGFYRATLSGGFTVAIQQQHGLATVAQAPCRTAQRPARKV